MKVPFGKFKGKHTDDVPSHYLIWCLKQDFVEQNYSAFYDYLLSIEDVLN